MATLIDLTGKVFGRLTVVDRHPENSHGNAVWRCRCDCGNFALVPARHLNNGATSSCGCLARDAVVQRNTKHGRAKTRTWNIWQGIIQRCEKPYATSFKRYGAKGVTVCTRWHDFANFLADMGECPAGLTIDRIDNQGHYEPGNCRWATYSDQNRNKSGSCTPEKAAEIKRLLVLGFSQRKAAAAVGMTQQVARQIAAGRHWAAQ